jgi:hypothetical protein
MLIKAISNTYSPGVIAWGGSRITPPSADRPMAGVLEALRSAGHPLVSGCATGADAAGVRTMQRPGCDLVKVAYQADGSGSWRGSNLTGVRLAAARGVAVSYWPSSPDLEPLKARLAERTRAVAWACNAGAFLVVASSQSKGTALLGRIVAGRGLPVMALCIGVGVDQLPALGAGFWSPVHGAEVGPLALWVSALGQLL